MQRYKKKGELNTNLNQNNRYYNPNKGIVDGMSYYFSKTEMNAVISETYYMLEQKKPINEQECWKIIENSFAAKFLNMLNNIKNGLETNINYTYTVIEFLQINPQYVDMFPSTRNNNVSSYQKRLVRSANFKIQYFKQKLNKVVKTYLKKWNDTFTKINLKKNEWY